MINTTTPISSACWERGRRQSDSVRACPDGRQNLLILWEAAVRFYFADRSAKGYTGQYQHLSTHKAPAQCQLRGRNSTQVAGISGKVQLSTKLHHIRVRHSASIPDQGMETRPGCHAQLSAFRRLADVRHDAAALEIP
jgi:hypothetical protein